MAKCAVPVWIRLVMLVTGLVSSAYIMSASTVVVAINAQLLRRAKL